MANNDQTMSLGLDSSPIQLIAPIDRQEILANFENRVVLIGHLNEENPQWYESEDGCLKTKSAVIKVDSEATLQQVEMVHTLQRLIEGICAPLVPKPMRAGAVLLPTGAALCYSMTELVTNAITLEDIWDTLNEETQDGLMQRIAQAVRLLGQVSFDPEHPNVLRALRNALVDSEYLDGVQLDSRIIRQPSFKVPDSPTDEVPEDRDKRIRLGGPSLGYFDSTEDFLIAFNGFYNKKRTSTLMGDMIGGLHITSSFQDWSDPDLCYVHLSASEMDWLHDHACFQHHDLEARNILVRYNIGEAEETNSGVHVAAIIDWEMAGFYPPGFEYVLKDGYLGANNMQYSWYRLFKDRVAQAIKLHEAPAPQRKFMKAITLIVESYLRDPGPDVGNQVRLKYLAREQLVRGKEVWEGWIRKPGAEVRKYGKKDDDLLEREVMRELGMM